MAQIGEVLGALSEEREYQDKLWGKSQEDGKHNTTEFVLFMQDYLDEARHILSRIAAPTCDEQALHIIRKVGAMCIACMEQNGVVRRDMSDLYDACERHQVDCSEETT